MIVAAIFGDAPPAFPRPRKRPFLNEHSQHGAAGMGRLDVEIVVADQGDYPSLAEKSVLAEHALDLHALACRNLIQHKVDAALP